MIPSTNEVEAAAGKPIEYIRLPGDRDTRRHHFGELAAVLPLSNWMSRSNVTLAGGRTSLVLTEVRDAELPAGLAELAKRNPTQLIFSAAEFAATPVAAAADAAKVSA